MPHVLTAVLFLPALGALALGFVPRDRVRVFQVGSLVVSLLTFGLSLLLLARFDAARDEQFQFLIAAPWVPQLGIQYKTGVDGIGLVMVLLTSLLSWISILSSWSAITERVKEYYIFLLVLETGMLGVFVALDLILFYLFWEAMLVPMYFIIGVWGGPRRIYATIKFVLYTLIGSLLMLVAIIVVHNATITPTMVAGAAGPQGTFDIVYLLEHRSAVVDLLLPATRFWVFLAFAFAFAIKVPMWPFHTWLPDAHVEAPTAGSVILAGVLLKMGTYGFVRFCLPLFPQECIRWAPWFITLAVIGIIYGALVALAQRDVKKLVAYSSVSHLGFVMLGLFAFTEAGIEGGMLQMINHGLSTGALFLIVGMLYERRHTREIGAFGGLWKVMPVFGTFLLITTLSSIGLPGLNGFIGEFLILLGAWAKPRVTALAATGVILGAIYMLWMIQRMMHGPLDKPENQDLRDLNRREIATLAPLVALMFLIGIWPNGTLRLFDRAVAERVRGPIESVRQVHAPLHPDRLLQTRALPRTQAGIMAAPGQNNQAREQAIP